MKNLYCKKVDLTIGSRKTRIYDYHLYLSSNTPYKRLDVDKIIREKWDEIKKRLNEHFKTYVSAFVKKYPVEEIKVEKEEADELVTDSGRISKTHLIIEISTLLFQQN